jgi:hypothetical protein
MTSLASIRLPVPRSVQPSPASRMLLAFGTVWLAAVLAGMVALVRYEMTAGVPAVAPVQWPRESRIRPVPDRATLVLLAHPRCPCTRASLGELAVLLARCRDLVEARVLAVHPEGAGPDWTDADLIDQAGSIPGATVVHDPGGREAALFGAATSGQVLLYGTDGALQFSGGITTGRGHHGDNAGRSAIEALLTGHAPASPRTPVFGCQLARSSAQRGPCCERSADHASVPPVLVGGIRPARSLATPCVPPPPEAR